MKYQYTYISSDRDMTSDYKSNFEVLNRKIIDNTLNVLYENHPEAQIINVVIYVTQNHNYDTYLLMTDFEVPIRNMDNQIVRVTSSWASNKVNANKIYSFETNPTLHPRVVCLENYWYDISNSSVMHIAKEYKHDGVIIDNILEQNQQLKNNLDKEIYNNLLSINKIKYLTTQRNALLCISILLLGLCAYLKMK
jgi:hypothetical protein